MPANVPVRFQHPSLGQRIHILADLVAEFLLIARSVKELTR